ncbi:MAG: hypothetical protein M3179_03080, partial [Actinomycetota bacterium]|nr:hypothetical protein [Actinomycetota bacterium]
MAARLHPKVERPEGLVYAPDFLSRDEERGLAEVLGGLELFEVKMRGQVAKRTTRHYGYTYDYQSARVAPAEPIPEWLE